MGKYYQLTALGILLIGSGILALRLTEFQSAKTFSVELHEPAVLRNLQKEELLYDPLPEPECRALGEKIAETLGMPTMVVTPVGRFENIQDGDGGGLGCRIVAEVQGRNLRNLGTMRSQLDVLLASKGWRQEFAHFDFYSGSTYEIGMSLDVVARKGTTILIGTISVNPYFPPACLGCTFDPASHQSPAQLQYVLRLRGAVNRERAKSEP